jgi:hypothetical protein
MLSQCWSAACRVVGWSLVAYDGLDRQTRNTLSAWLGEGLEGLLAQQGCLPDDVNGKPISQPLCLNLAFQLPSDLLSSSFQLICISQYNLLGIQVSVISKWLGLRCLKLFAGWISNMSRVYIVLFGGCYCCLILNYIGWNRWLVWYWALLLCLLLK